jgi:glucose-1-phosphate adenylyltransferase
MNAHEDGTIYEFEEKPKQPKSTLASMGIYIFTWEKLRHYLIEDEKNPDSSNDFGKNIIPLMLGDNQLLKVYRFDGYWKDVGTVDSLWEANLDLLDPNVDLDLADKNWKIYSKNTGNPPQYISDTAVVENSLVTDGCEIYGNIDYSVLFKNVIVEEGANVKYSLIMPGAKVKKGATVQYAIVAEDAVVEEGAVVGEDPQVIGGENWSVTLVGDKLTVGKNAVITAGKMITENVEEGEKI